MDRAALISVSDRTGLDELAKALSHAGYTLLCTSGSGKFLSDLGLATVAIEKYTGQPEILGGRVKTLHPKIHAGLLAKRDDPEHMKQLEMEGILPIDVAVVNLYPFIQNIGTDRAADPAKMIELIDVGGPTMIRAAAKNFKSVLPLLDPKDYPEIIAILESRGDLSSVAADLRARLSSKVFSAVANYDLQIATYLSSLGQRGDDSGVANPFSGSVGGVVLAKEQDLRYGENPHQKAAYYRELTGSPKGWTQLSGKELSYNNLLDFDAALKLVQSLPGGSPAATIIKHLNPCGAAQGKDALEAVKKAKTCDPRSHFGGIIALNTLVGDGVAHEVTEDFAEIIVAPEYTPEALNVLKSKKNLRVIKVNDLSPPARELRSAAGGVLMQEPDRPVSAVSAASVAGKRAPSRSELEDLQFAWTICSHVKSNAIVIVKDRMLLGVGAGQMSRIDSVELAISKAKRHGHDLSGAAAASDAFFPFPDSVEALAAEGVRCVVAPSGSKKDNETVAAADKLGVSILFATDRHFRH